MAWQYDFGLRFRAEDEIEGAGSLLVTLSSIDDRITASIRRMINDISAIHPSRLFDGIVLYGCQEIQE